jgi:hypothetical protein
LIIRLFDILYETIFLLFLSNEGLNYKMDFIGAQE